MSETKIFEAIKSEKVVAIVREKTAERAIEVSRGIIAGGQKVIEISAVTPQFNRALQALNAEFGDKVLLGAGTVLNGETVRSAVDNGARFIITPAIREEVLTVSQKMKVPVVTGVFTPTEVARVLDYGAEVIKLFPSSQFNFNIIKELKGPFPSIEVIPAGGMTLQNAKKWLENGAFAVAVSSYFTENTDYNQENISEKVRYLKRELSL